MLSLAFNNVKATAAGALPNSLSPEFEAAFAEGQWDEAAEIAYETVLKDPNAGLAKLKGAYALFQKGLPNAALMLIKRISPSQWKEYPQGQDRFVEIVSLFQKKVPLNILPGRLDQANIEDVSPYLRDEILFAKGRVAFEAKQSALASSYLQRISKGSRFYGQAHYLIATMAVQVGDYKTAATEFSAVFNPTVYEQSSEFWRDMGAQTTSHWGSISKWESTRRYYSNQAASENWLYSA